MQCDLSPSDSLEADLAPLESDDGRLEGFVVAPAVKENHFFTTFPCAWKLMEATMRITESGVRLSNLYLGPQAVTFIRLGKDLMERIRPLASKSDITVRSENGNLRFHFH